MRTTANMIRSVTRRYRFIPPLVAILAAVAGECLAQAPAPAEIQQNAPLMLETDKAQLVHLAEPARTVFVANPEIADVQVPTPTSFLIYGKKPGTTTAFAISATGVTTSYAVRISRPLGDLEAAVQAAVPGSRVSVTAQPNGITISGSVGSPRNAERIKAAAKQFLGDKENVNYNVAVSGATQVMLRVTVAEVSRNVEKQLGVNWSALGTIGSIAHLPALTLNANADPIVCVGTAGTICPSANFNGVITALDSSGLATILAEPTLTAVSGETANFLAGGEYPIPVPQGLQVVTIDYKRFGVSLDFTPTVLDANRISIKVRPEVSALTSVGALTIDGISVPALTVQRAETTVELGSGESFAIAGLYQHIASNQITAFPWLADVPVLGALFRSSTFMRNESELVIIVTPYIVRPVAQRTDLHQPGEGLRWSSDIERILRGRLSATPQAVASPMGTAAEPRLRGAAGFMLE